MQQFISRGIVVILCVLLGFQLATRCTRRPAAYGGMSDARRAELEARAAVWADSATYYKDKAGREVATRQAVEVRSAEELRTVLGQRDNLQHVLDGFHRPEAVGTLSTVATLPSVTFSFPTPAPCVFAHQFTRRDSLSLISVRVDQHGLSLDTVQLKARLSFVVGKKKRRHWWRRRELTIDAVSNNPAVRITGLDAAVLHPRPAWYERGWVKWAGGALLGAASVKIGAQVVRRTQRHR